MLREPHGTRYQNYNKAAQNLQSYLDPSNGPEPIKQEPVLLDILLGVQVSP